MSSDARSCLGTVYRVVLDFLTERGLLEEVKARLTAPSRKVLEKLPFAFAWQDSGPLEEMEKVLYARSPDLVADLGHAAGRQLSGTLVAPVLKMALSLFGQTPGSMFGHLDPTPRRQRRGDPPACPLGVRRRSRTRASRGRRSA